MGSMDQDVLAHPMDAQSEIRGVWRRGLCLGVLVVFLEPFLSSKASQLEEATAIGGVLGLK